MKKILFFILSVCCSGVSYCAENLLAAEGKTDYSIVFTAREKEAAEELADHLKEITGAVFTLVPEEKWSSSGKPAFYVGDTLFSRKQGVDVKKMNREEWFIKNYGKNIVLTGGIPRGTLYAVYELLEKNSTAVGLPGIPQSYPNRKNLCSVIFLFRINPVTTAVNFMMIFPKHAAAVKRF